MPKFVLTSLLFASVGIAFAEDIQIDYTDCGKNFECTYEFIELGNHSSIVGFFSRDEGLAIGSKGFQEYGYVNRDNEWVIPAKFKVVNNFYKGLAVVMENDRFGYIDTKGNYVIPPKFKEARGFSEGLALARVDYNYAGYFSENTAWVFDPVTRKYGYINKDGSWFIQPMYDFASGFNYGLAWVRIGDKIGYIDKGNNTVIPLKFDFAFRFTKEQLALVAVGNRIDGYKYGYIDRSGKYVIPPMFDSAESFRDGIARVSINGKMGYIGPGGQFISQMYASVAPFFHEGLAAVKVVLGEEWGFHVYRYGYINREGRMVVPPIFERAGDFNNGIASVSDGYQNRLIKIIKMAGK